jgi:hypothetical protein
MALRHLLCETLSSTAHRDPFGIEIAKTSLEEAGLGFLDVVTDAAKFHALGSRLINRIASTGNVVAGLSDAADARGQVCG